jgi:hypothetical protein
MSSGLGRRLLLLEEGEGVEGVPPGSARLLHAPAAGPSSASGGSGDDAPDALVAASWHAVAAASRSWRRLTRSSSRQTWPGPSTTHRREPGSSAASRAVSRIEGSTRSRDVATSAVRRAHGHAAPRKYTSSLAQRLRQHYNFATGTPIPLVSAKPIQKNETKRGAADSTVQTWHHQVHLASRGS